MRNQEFRRMGEDGLSPVRPVKAEKRVREIVLIRLTKTERALGHAATVPIKRRGKYLRDAQSHLSMVRRDIDLVFEPAVSQRLVELETWLFELSY